jgi:hypothetical protein
MITIFILHIATKNGNNYGLFITSMVIIQFHNNESLLSAIDIVCNRSGLSVFIFYNCNSINFKVQMVIIVNF